MVCDRLYFKLSTSWLWALVPAVSFVGLVQTDPVIGQRPGRDNVVNANGVDVIVHFDPGSLVVGEPTPITISLESLTGPGPYGTAAITFLFEAEHLNLISFEWLSDLDDESRYIFTTDLPQPQTALFGPFGSGVPLFTGEPVAVGRLTVELTEPVLVTTLETHLLFVEDIQLSKPTLGPTVGLFKGECPPTASTGNDCNDNGTPDTCDIAAGASGDCNNNGVPDECDIADGTSLDVEPSGMPDGIPDECIRWVGAGIDNFWSNGSNWQSESPPKNTQSQGFSVILEGAKTDVVLDVDIGIDSLRLLSGARLSLLFGNLTLELDTGIRNDGLLTVADKHSILAGTSFVLKGLGIMHLAGPFATLSSLTDNSVVTNESTIEGAGVIEAALLNKNLVNANINDATLALAGPRQKTNNGTMMATNGGRLHIDTSMLDGHGALLARGGTIFVDGDVDDLPDAAVTEGVTGDSLTVADSGQFLVDGDVSIIISGATVIDSGGVYQADPDRTEPTSATLSTGELLISTNQAGGAGTMLLNDNMGVETTGDLTMTQGDACGAALRGGCTPPKLSVVGSSKMAVAGSFMAEVSGDIAVGSGTDATSAGGTPVSFGVSGDFVNHSTNPLIFNWEDGPLVLDGEGVEFEVAGEDRGRSSNGFENNFAIGEVRLATGADVRFQDAFDNDQAGQSPCTEALYVHQLVLEAETILIVDDCVIYYEHFTPGLKSVIVREGCGDILQVPSGDGNSDGFVDLQDFGTFQFCVEESVPGSLGPLCGAFDFDLDDRLGVVDYGGFQAVFDGSP